MRGAIVSVILEAYYSSEVKGPRSTDQLIYLLELI